MEEDLFSLLEWSSLGQPLGVHRGGLVAAWGPQGLRHSKNLWRGVVTWDYKGLLLKPTKHPRWMEDRDTPHSWALPMSLVRVGLAETFFGI